MYAKQTIVILLLTFTTIFSSSNVNFENLDIESLLANEEETKSVFACLMDKKPCGEMQGLRDTIPVLIQTKCSQCTPKQKMTYDHVSKVVLEKKPDLFNALVLKYSTKENYE